MQTRRKRLPTFSLSFSPPEPVWEAEGEKQLPERDPGEPRGRDPTEEEMERGRGLVSVVAMEKEIVRGEEGLEEGAERKVVTWEGVRVVVKGAEMVRGLETVMGLVMVKVRADEPLCKKLRYKPYHLSSRSYSINV